MLIRACIFTIVKMRTCKENIQFVSHPHYTILNPANSTYSFNNIPR